MKIGLIVLLVFLMSACNTSPETVEAPSKIRIAVASFAMETCTFCPRKTDIEHFEHYGAPLTGNDVLSSGRDTKGFVKTLSEYQNVEAIGVYAVRDPLGGSMGSWVTAQAFEKYTSGIVERLSKIKDLDAVYLPLHGAMAVEGIPRPEAELVKRIKQKLGNIPVAVTLDLHANEDQELAKYADIILIVKRFPHYDFALMGERAARLLIRTIKGTYKPVIESRRPNVAFATVYGGTHQGVPRDMMERARRWENRRTDVFVSIAMGFPFADVPDMGMSVFVMTNNDPKLAKQIADDINQFIIAGREKFEYDIPKLSEGVDQGFAYLQENSGPIVLVNLSDRLGDATHILGELISHKQDNFVVATIADSDAIELIKASKVVGDKITTTIGGHTSKLAGKPITIEGEVSFIGEYNIGGQVPSDLVAITFGNNNWLLLTPTRYQVRTRSILDHANIPVETMDIFVVKSRNHFRRGFMETGLAKHAVVIDAPGHGPADIGQLDYKYLPKDTYSRFFSKHSVEKLNGTLVVVNKLGDDVSFIDLNSKTIVTSLPTGKGPHEIAVTNDGKWAVSTDYVGGNSLTVFDVQAAKVTRTISLAKYPRPHGILFMQDQIHVAVSSEGSNTAVIANIHSGKIVSAIETQQKGSHMVALPHASDVIYTTNMGDNSVSQLSVEKRQLIKTIAMPDTPEAVTVNKSGTELWVGSNKDGLISIFDTATDKLIKQWSGYTFPYRILLTADEKYAVVPDYRQDTLDIFDVKEKRKLTRIQLDEKFGPKGVIFHPNDRVLFLSSYSQDKVVVMKIPSGEILFTLPTGDGPDGVGYSPFELK